METQHISLGKHFWGLGASFITLLVGGWLMLAPYALGYQPSGKAWVNQTILDFWTGLGVAVISLISLAAFTATLVGELRRAGIIQERPKPKAAQTPAPAAIPATGPTEDEFEHAMTVLASALATDLAEKRHGEKQPELETP
jgi:hypothetical protein